MSEQIQFELASPNKLFSSKKAMMVSVPGCDGRFGILPGHAPLAAKVSAGLVEIYDTDMSVVTESFFVTGGFCQVTTERCTVLADQVFKKEELKIASVEREISDLLAKANAAETEDERLAIADQIVIARAKLEAAA